MSQKTKGLITSITIGVVLVILNVVALIVGLVVTDGGWGTVGVVIVMLFISGFTMLGLLIYGAVKHKQNEQDFGLGVIYGIVVMLASSVVLGIMITLVGMFSF